MAHWAALTAAALLISAPGFTTTLHPSPQQVKEQISQCYHLQAAALDSGNVKGYMKFCAKNYHDAGLQGQYTDFEATSRLVHTTITMVSHFRAKFTIEKIMQKNTREIVFCKSVFTGKVRNSMGKLSSWKISGVVVDEWVLQKAGWRKLVSRSVRAQTRVGGKPLVWQRDHDIWLNSRKKHRASAQ